MLDVCTRNALILEHRPLALWIAKRFSARRIFQSDEIRDHAILSLVEAAAAFDPSRGLAFNKYVSKIIRYRLIEFTRKLDQIANMEAHGDPEWAARVPDREAEATPDDAGPDEFDARTAELPEEERRVLAMVCLDGCTFSEAGRRLGRSPRWASKRYRSARSRVA